MKEIRYSAKRQGQQTLSNEKGVGPETDKLKDKFKDGSIPLQTDFNQLIDIADVGRKACGQSPQQNGPGTGLKLGDDGTLNLKIGSIDNQDFSPLILEKDILSVDLGSGLINKTNGICVGQGNGITVNSNDVTVKAKNSTIKVEPAGISVGIGWGVTVGGDGLDIVGSDGITVSAKGVAVKAGNGITVNTSGVSIDTNKVLPRGMIVMFSGNSAPTGWAFCDGNDGTPDLRNRFIACGNTMNDTGGKSSNSLNGSKDNKTYSVTTSSGKSNISVTVNETKLTIDQLPEHSHLNGMRYNSHQGNLYGLEQGRNQITDDKLMNDNTTVVKSVAGYIREFKTSLVGSGQGHKHTASASDSGHTHSATISTPYYLLAFIMKI